MSKTSVKEEEGRRERMEIPFRDKYNNNLRPDDYLISTIKLTAQALKRDMFKSTKRNTVNKAEAKLVLLNDKIPHSI